MEKFVIANWKCNPATLAEAKELFNKVVEELKDIKNTEIVVCPPFVYLAAFSNYENLHIGGQDCFWADGAHTGQVSPKMLKDLGCQYVLLGHSERKRDINETNEMINKKMKAALSAGLKPILCLSSTKRGQEAKVEMKIQLNESLAGIEKKEIENIIFTYEPVWAISTTAGGAIATPENIAEGKIFIKETISDLFGSETANKIKVIYGGSVDSKNIEKFLKIAKMDGALIGAASLEAADFIEAIKKTDAL